MKTIKIGKTSFNAEIAKGCKNKEDFKKAFVSVDADYFWPLVKDALKAK